MSGVRVRFFGGAAEEFGSAETEVDGARDLAGLLDRLSEEGGSRFTEILDQCSFFVDGEHHRSTDVELPPGCRVDVLPPFAGG